MFNLKVSALLYGISAHKRGTTLSKILDLGVAYISIRAKDGGHSSLIVTARLSLLPDYPTHYPTRTTQPTWHHPFYIDCVTFSPFWARRYHPLQYTCLSCFSFIQYHPIPIYKPLSISVRTIAKYRKVNQQFVKERLGRPS